MNANQKKKCHAIIHSHAMAAAAANAVPVPGLGIAADLVTMTSMTMALCAVFGGNISQQAAKTLAIAAIKNTTLRQPIRMLAKELSKLVPGLGQVIAPSIAVVMLEAAGWILAAELEEKFDEKQSKAKKPRTRAPVEKAVMKKPRSRPPAKSAAVKKSPRAIRKS